MKEKSILCYGDSNTWGYVPTTNHEDVTQRYNREQRWPAKLQLMLGNGYYVIEEGLNGRTTNVDHISPPDRNGKTYLPSCLYSQSPIDLVILALGGNDFKTYFDRDASAIRAGMAELVDIIQSSPYGPDMINAPQILLVTPGKPLAIAEKHVDEEGRLFMQGCREKAKALVSEYESLAKEKNCHFLDISPICSPSELDGVHLDESGHAKMAIAMYEAVNKIL